MFMKTKKTILFLLFAFAMSGLTYGQLGTTTATYNSGDIETDKNFTWYSGTQSSNCPGMITVTIPVGSTIISTDVSYDMTSDANSAVYRQRSHFRCVSPGGNSEASMTNGPSIYTPGTASYYREGLDIANGVVGGGDIEFEMHAGATHYVNYCSIDSVKVDNNTWTVTVTYIPAGFPAQAINPTPADAGIYVGLDDDLSWDFGANTDNYDVYFGTDNPPTTKVVDFASAGASGIFDPGTMNETQTYYWQVVSHNTNGYTEGSLWSFTTQCGSFLTPFTEDFESVTTPELPYCWTSVVNSTSTWADVITNTYNGYTGPNCLKFSNDNDASATLIFVSPQIDLGAGSMANKMVHFYQMGFSYPNITVGTMSDPTNEATFTPYESFLVYDTHNEHNVYFNNYVGTDTYIAFKMDPTTSYQEAYIDDITIDDLPSCIKAEGLYADNMTTNSAWLNWTDFNGATTWNIEYGISGFTPTGIPTVSGVSNPHEITGLSSATEYDFYVQTDCGGGDLSAWSSLATFLTPCDYYTIPLTENFDASLDLPICWTSIIQTGDGFTINGIQNFNANSQFNCYHMENGWDDNSNLILVLPPFSTLSDKSVKFFAMNNGGSYDLEVGTMSNPSNPSTFVSLASITTTSSYQEFDVWFNTYTGTNEYIAIKHGNSSSYAGIYIDDIAVDELPSCLPPVNLFVDNITTNSAQIHWSETGSATNWIIEVGDFGFVPGTGTYSFQYNHSNPFGSDQNINLPGLASATTYDVYVQSDCGGVDFSTWSGPVTFLTGFNQFAALPVTEDFESGMGITGNDPANPQNWSINTTLQHGGLNSVQNTYLENGDNVLYMLGTFDFTAKSNVMLTFWQIAKTDGQSDHCYIEISTDGGATFDQLPISTYAGAGKYYETNLYNNPEGPCFDEDSYIAWGTGYETPDNSWWRKEYFDLTTFNTFNNVVIRFRLVSDNWTNKSGWYVDDISVEAMGAPAFYANPLSITEDVTSVMPAVLDLTLGNSGGLPTTYTASVIYNEADLLTENFDAGIPGTWTIVNNGNNSVTWADTTGKYGYNFDGTRFAWADGYQNYGSAGTLMDDDLITPVIDASAYVGGGLQLEYDHAFDADYNPGDTARIYVYDGASWVMIYESWVDDGLLSYSSHGVHKVFNVSMFANANLQVKFNYIEGSLTSRGQYFAIDNFRLRASSSALGWLTIDGGEFTSGTAMPDADMFPSIVNVNMNGTGLAPGVYTADIEVTSTDPGFTTTLIPVTMNVVAGSTISGNVTYANVAMTAIDGCSVELRDATDAVLFSTSTDAAGYYEFPGIIDGNYSLVTTYTASYSYSTDVGDLNVVINHVLGIPLTGVFFLAGDVSGDAIVDVADVNLMINNILGLSSGYPDVPAWIFENPAVIVNGANVTQDFQGIQAGDTDGSW